MCVSSLILSKAITFSNAGLAEVAMRGRCAGLTLPEFFLNFKLQITRLAQGHWSCTPTH